MVLAIVVNVIRSVYGSVAGDIRYKLHLSCVRAHTRACVCVSVCVMLNYNDFSAREVKFKSSQASFRPRRGFKQYYSLTFGFNLCLVWNWWILYSEGSPILPVRRVHFLYEKSKQVLGNLNAD